MKLLTFIARTFVGVLFIISGFIKLNDPIGFSYKLQEYFSSEVLNLPFLEPYALALAIFVVVFEVVLEVSLEVVEFVVVEVVVEVAVEVAVEIVVVVAVEWG